MIARSGYEERTFVLSVIVIRPLSFTFASSGQVQLLAQSSAVSITDLGVEPQAVEPHSVAGFLKQSVNLLSAIA